MASNLVCYHFTFVVKLSVRALVTVNPFHLFTVNFIHVIFQGGLALENLGASITNISGIGGGHTVLEYPMSSFQMRLSKRKIFLKNQNCNCFLKGY